MNATSLDLDTVPASTALDPARFQKNLTAVYTACNAELRRLADARDASGAHAWDVLQDAFLHVLEHPPADTSARGLRHALQYAVRIGVNRESKRRSDDRAMRIALRKRSL